MARIAIFGSNSLCVSLIQSELVDEFRIMINPLILGTGNPLFNGIKDKLNLRLLKTRLFASGGILLHYQPDRTSKTMPVNEAPHRPTVKQSTPKTGLPLERLAGITFMNKRRIALRHTCC